jgi:Ran GTPase-activating protein (RanGAP) involved in mRNA processing and transport
LGESAARALAALLAHPACALTALDLGRNESIGSDGGAALLDALAANARLEALVLDGCGLGSAAGRALAAGLRANGTLRVLDLADNAGLGDAGAASPALADALWDNASLTALDLSGCGVGDAGAAELGRGVASNKALRQLRLARSPRLSAEAAAALRQAAPPRLHVILRD